MNILIYAYCGVFVPLKLAEMNAANGIDALLLIYTFVCTRYVLQPVVLVLGAGCVRGNFPTTDNPR